ncbi:MULTISPECIES: MerR family transcriptional regulator [unclassified Microbacterium]|uniref:MerR family transcriptional regulator n=1 Tax=Microbacterium TaxID=33882 RepID=UPI003BA173F2
MRDDVDGLTVGQAAAQLGVTVRTLHHWDAIGLASPSERTPAGYRLYTAPDLDRLRRVAIYREIGVALEDIRAILDGASPEAAGTLRAAHAQLEERIARLNRLGSGLERMIAAHERGVPLADEVQREVFGSGWDPEQARGAREAYGGTRQWRQFAEAAADRTAEEWREVADRVAGVERSLADAMDRGVAPGSAEADDLVERHREAFSAYFPLSRQMQVCLARRYESDPGFAAHYDGVRVGLAAWFRRAVDESARARGIDPETAVWE